MKSASTRRWFPRTKDEGRRREATIAVTGLGRRKVRDLGRTRGHVVIFEFNRSEFLVRGCTHDWVESRAIGGLFTPSSGPQHNLLMAVHATLGLSLETSIRSARSRGWAHWPGVGLACPVCAGPLEAFGRSRPGVVSDIGEVVFVCAAERMILRAGDLADNFRLAVEAWCDYQLARSDADQAERGDATRRWSYCIELDDAVGARTGDKPWIYVGQSGFTPEERFERHRAGKQASRLVRDHGVRLRPDLYEGQPVLRTADESEAYERYKFHHLAAGGWPVKGGH